MNLCLIMKYPPIEGGVSTTAYWTARGLAELGHVVHVVTNAAEVEPTYRIHLEPEDEPWLQPTFAEGGRVVVHTSEPYGPKLSHIPAHNPMVTKLAGMAADVVRQHDCKVVYGYYLEPYGLAAHLAAAWTGRPYVIRHAGSDLDRLMKQPDLAIAYAEVIRGANAVVTTPGLADRFRLLGVAPERICTHLTFGLPDRFSPKTPPMDVMAAVARFQESGLLPQDAPPPNPARPTIGIYGKVGERKGSLDLVAALGSLRAEGLDFNFLALTHGEQEPAFRRAVSEAGLADRTCVLPFLPHWRVASFIRACSAVCFLERDFPIAIHGPVIPREVLACGTCLILSGEIARKQFYRSRIRDGENMLLVADPRDHAALAGRLRSVILHPEAAREIGRRGLEIAEAVEDFNSFVSGYSELFASVAASGAPARPPEPEKITGAAMVEPPMRRAVLRRLPGSAFLLGDQLESLLAEAGLSDGRTLSEWELAAHFAHTVTARLASGGQTVHPALPEVLDFESELVLLHTGRQEPPFSQRDALGLRRINPVEAGRMRPLRSNWSRTVIFSRDVTSVLPFLQRHEMPPELPPGPVAVLFHRWPNAAVTTVRVGALIAAILNLSDGQLTCEEQLSLLADQGLLPADVTAPSYWHALRRLYRERYLVFVEGARVDQP